MTLVFRLRRASVRLAGALLCGTLSCIAWLASVWIMFTQFQQGFGVGGFLLILVVALPSFVVACVAGALALTLLCQAAFLLAGREIPAYLAR